MAAIVVVFDFDKTIIDCDSDNWVIDQFGLNDLFSRLLPTMPWNPLMDRMMAQLHSRGRFVEEIAECLRRAPLDPHVAQAIKAAYDLGCELRVVSDANLFFIETVLRHHGLLQCFSEINTNPSFVDEDGRLKIRPYHDFTQSSHGCSLCPPNMCKGMIIDQIRASVLLEGKRQFIYLCDGQGDFCPSLRLSDGDYVMPRKNYPLWNLICENPQLLKAQVHEWINGDELQAVLLQLINQSMDADRTSSNQLLSVDCKYEELSFSSTEGLRLPLRVPH